MQRKLAASVSMTHYITMDKDLTVFRLMEKGGPVETDNTYQIDGPELATTTLKVSIIYVRFFASTISFNLIDRFPG